MKLTRHYVIVCIFALCVSVGFRIPAFAEDFQVTREEFRDILGQPPAASLQSSGAKTKELKTKGFTPKGVGGIVPDEYEKLIEYPMARSLILFDFDSDQIQEDSYPLLKNLAETLHYDLPNIKLTVVGHTDSVGSEEYNLELSKRRAQAVRNFLVTNYDIAPDRFFLRWFGETQPYNQENPKDGQNRRVEFIRVE